MEECSHLEDFRRLTDEIKELRDCKTRLGELNQFKTTSVETISELKESIRRLFEKFEGNGRPGIIAEVNEIKRLLTKFEENVIELFERLEKVEKDLSDTVSNVSELSTAVKALVDIETERKNGSKEFRTSVRNWAIGFVGTILLTSVVTWINIQDKKISNEEQIQKIIKQALQYERASKDTVRDTVIIRK